MGFVQTIFQGLVRCAGSRFEVLQIFATSIATVMPTTSRVEGDFSLMSRRRDEHCTALTDFSLEGVMHENQYMAVLGSAQFL